MISANLTTSIQQEVNKLVEEWKKIRGNKDLTDKDVARLLDDIYLLRQIMEKVAVTLGGRIVEGKG